MQRIAIYTLLVALACGTPLLLAGHTGHTRHARNSCQHCPRCQAKCKLEVSKDDETKQCFVVECKTICIPPVTFPWQKKYTRVGDCSGDGCCGDGCCGDGCGSKSGCCATTNKCAKSRTIRVLMKREYECPKCKYKWTPCKQCCAGNSGNCCHLEDGEATPLPLDEPVPTPAEVQQSQALLPSVHLLPRR